MSNAGIVRIGLPNFKSLRKTRLIGWGETIRWSVSGDKMYDGTKRSKPLQASKSHSESELPKTKNKSAGNTENKKPTKHGKLRLSHIKKRQKSKSKAEIRLTIKRVKAAEIRLEKRLKEIRRINAKKKQYGRTHLVRGRNNKTIKTSSWIERYGISKEDFIRSRISRSGLR